jgi:hypothetical protein
MMTKTPKQERIEAQAQKPAIALKPPKGRVNVSLRIDPDLRIAAGKRAIDDHCTRSELINRALRMFLFGCERALPAKEAK